VTFEVLCNSKCSIACMGFVATCIVKNILFSMLHGVGLFYFCWLFCLFIL
jgi:hypothetical protein